jgi:hypothetical protein
VTAFFDDFEFFVNTRSDFFFRESLSNKFVDEILKFF